MTLEEAQAEIVRLQEELNTAHNERDNYSKQLTNTQKDLEKVRTINQEYFLKLSAQHNPPKPDDPEPETVSCEDFAKTLTI